MLEAITNVDGAILLAIQSIRVEFLNPIIEFYTHLGDAGFLWILLSLILLINRKTRKVGAISLGALVFSLIFTNLTIKPLFDRTRPWLVVEGLLPLVDEPDPHSFPSGHTSAAFAAAVVWFRTAPVKWERVLAVVLAALMGLSRLYVGVHYPTDVIVGALVGCLSAWCALKLYAYAAKKQGL